MKHFPESTAQRVGGRGFAAPLWLFLTVAAVAQEPLLAPADVPGARIEGTATYNGKALYGYIDGGAELYYEYGFRRASVQDILKDSLRIHLEVFEMDSPEGAAGIFSVTSQGCSRESLWDFRCASRFQVHLARGRYFIRAANVRGTPAEEILTRSVAALAAAKSGESLCAPPSLFLDSLFQRGQKTFTMARGPLGIQNGLEEWTELVEGLDQYWLCVLVQEWGTTTAKIALLEIQSELPSTPDLWRERAPAGSVRSVIADGWHRFLLCETNAAKPEIRKYHETLERYRTHTH